MFGHMDLTDCIDTAPEKELASTLDRLEGQDVILDRLEEWPCANFIRFNKIKGKVLHLGWGNSQHQYRQGHERIDSSPAEKDLDILVDEKLHVSQQCMLQARKPAIS